MQIKNIEMTVTSCDECISEYVCRFKEGKIISEQMLIKTTKELPTGIMVVSAECEHFNAMPKVSASNKKDGGKTCSANMVCTGDVGKMTKDVKIELIGRMDV